MGLAKGGSYRRESREERMGDALALGGEEGRGKLRKAAGIGKHELIRRYPNGATRYDGVISHRKVG